MSRIKQKPITVLAGVNANGAGSTSDVSDYLYLILTVTTTGNTNATIKFGISNELTAPNFSNAPSSSNIYDYAQILPLNSQTALVGSTGIVLNGTDIVKIYTLQTDYINWMCPIVSGYTSGAITVKLTAANDFTR